ncbi:hypothetical protein [Mycobacterium sp. AZCC_0083]|uniref:DUF7246 family protein n=1 Tax=Mycobacterium sp. AZCC_0083 TaxID=2735882 RepID=UPI0016118ED7|nr:hypothetical protein [Mycobacterium sp. AZCC_0083]MBB5167100.1 hypothetical protein [Mycobacterium sp. AZCC_0083]
MNTKRKVKPKNDPHLYEFHIPGKATLVPGTEVALKGRPGRYRFRYADRPRGDGYRFVLTFVGGPLHGQSDKFVSVYPDRVTRVHRASKTLVNIQKEKTQ